MQNSKWAAKSRTVIGVVTIMLVTFAPIIGFSFSETDVNFINQQVDTVITGIAGILAIYGRIKSTTTLTVLPKFGGSNV